MNDLVFTTRTTDDLIFSTKLWAKEHGLDDPKTQLNKMIEEVGEIAHEINRQHLDTPELADALGDTFVTLITLSYSLDCDLRDCLDGAYNTIRKRKGKTVDGMFIKEEK